MDRPACVVVLWALLALAGVAFAAEPDPAPSQVETYVEVNGVALQARIFRPAQPADRPFAAIVLFHGGGWSEGEASWMDASAQALAKAGLVAITVDYRLSDQKSVTPYDAVADARTAIRWVRREAGWLGIDPKRVAAGGTSAGGHLAAAAAIFDDPWGDEISARPDALVRSPALSVATSDWFGKGGGQRHPGCRCAPLLRAHAPARKSL